VEHLAEDGYDAKMGARPLSRKINELIKVPLSKKILFEGIAPGNTVVVDYVNDKFEFSTTTTTQPQVDENGFIVLG
jgi:ATP-dependent Clp protease ATP-binding subunit ClpA